MSGHNPPNIPEQGAGGAGPPPEDPMATQTPTQTTFSIPMGRAAHFTTLQQHPYGYQMHMPMMPTHQMNQHTLHENCQPDLSMYQSPPAVVLGD